MWIATRIIITIASFFYRFFFRHLPESYPMTHNGVPYSAKVSSSKTSSITTVETPVTSSFICTLSAESRLDRWAKMIGFGDEIQVRDAEFNRRIFILGDHPLTADYLSSSSELRERICAIIPSQVKSIAITGETLKIVGQHNVPASSLLDDLVFIRASVEKIQHNAKSRFVDPYYTRAVILESLIMAVLTYGLLSFAEMRFFLEDYHLDGVSLIKAGLGAGLAVTAVIVGITWALLGKSSRAIRLMIENGLMMLLALPIIGYEIISDVNRGLDDSEPIIVTSRVTEKYTRTHGTRRRYTTYHLKLAHTPSTQSLQFKMPGTISVTHELYWQVHEGENIDCEISLGYLGFPWYRSLTPHLDEH